MQDISELMWSDQDRSIVLWTEAYDAAFPSYIDQESEGVCST